MTFKVGIFGSCVSRDPFSSVSSSEFSVGPYVARVSSVGFSDAPLEFDPDWYAHLGLFERRCVEIDLRKSMLDHLKSEPMDALIIDLIDERFDIVSVDGVRLSKARVLSDGFMHRYGARVEILDRLNDEITKAWKAGITDFFNEIGAILNGRPIVLHEAFWATHYRGLDGELHKYGPMYTRLGVMHNALLETYYRHIKKSLPGIKTIKLPRRLVLGDEGHRWSKEPFHYSREYYLEFLSQFRNFINAPISLEQPSVLSTVRPVIVQ